MDGEREREKGERSRALFRKPPPIIYIYIFVIYLLVIYLLVI